MNKRILSMCLGLLLLPQVKAEGEWKFVAGAAMYPVAKALYNYWVTPHQDFSIYTRAYFSDFVGDVTQVKQFVDALHHPETCEQAKRWFVIEGPAHCGKTLLAHIMATELHANLLEVSGDELGTIDHRIELATRNKRCLTVLFVNHVKTLEALQKFREKKNLVVIAETEQDVSCDPSWQIISLSLPDEAARKQLLVNYLQKVKLADKAEDVAQTWATKLFDPVVLQDFVKEAACVAAQRQSKEVDESCFEEAYKKFVVSEGSIPLLDVKGKSFSDIIGQDEVVAQAQKFVQAIVHAAAGEALGAKRLRGLIIDGPKNNGKTLFAQVIAAELGAEVLHVSSDFFSMKREPAVDLEELIESMFAEALDHAGRTVLFIEHLDEAVPGTVDLVYKQIKELESKNLLVIIESAPCEKEWSRIGMEQLLVTPPDVMGRKKLFTHFLQGSKFDVSEQLTWASVGFMKEIVQEAALIAVQKNLSEVTKACFDEACVKYAAELAPKPWITASCVRIEDKNFADVVGQDEAVAGAKKFIETVTHADECKAVGLKPVRGLVIESAPENGKTLLAHSIAAALQAYVIPVTERFFSGDDEFEEQFTYVLNFAQERAVEGLTVLLLSHLEKLSVPNAAEIIKTKLEDFEGHKNLIIIYEVNECSMGCKKPVDWQKLGFERLKLFTPNLYDRKKLIEHFLKEAHVTDAALVNEVSATWSKELKEVSSGNLRKFVQQAILVAMKQKSDVKKEHFDEAFLDHAGGTKHTIVRTKEERWRTSVHEAGHALITVLVGLPVKRVSSIPRERWGGVTFVGESHEDKYDYKKDELLHEVMICFGSLCAEKCILGQSTPGVSMDLMMANQMLRAMVKEWGMGSGETAAAIGLDESDKHTAILDQEISNLRQLCLQVTTTLLGRHRSKLEALAQALMEKETVYEDEVYRIVGQPRDEATALLQA